MQKRERERERGTIRFSAIPHLATLKIKHKKPYLNLIIYYSIKYEPQIYVSVMTTSLCYFLINDYVTLGRHLFPILKKFLLK